MGCTAVFDVNGTLFDLAPVRRALVELGAPPAALEAWFQRILHGSATVTIVESYQPFKELAAQALRTTLAQLDLDPEGTAPLEALGKLEPYPDAASALRRLREAEVEVMTLSNGARSDTEKLLERSGLSDLVDEIVSCDEVERFKPHRAPYKLAARRAGGAAVLVAAHGWDVVGAQAAGLDAVWIDREEREWPFPLPPPRRVHDLASAAEAIIEGSSG